MLAIDSMTGHASVDDYARSLQLFGETVIPLFDKDPMHSTRRMRLAALEKQQRG
jgi:hypothetical protein